MSTFRTSYCIENVTKYYRFVLFIILYEMLNSIADCMKWQYHKLQVIPHCVV